jgi:putative NADH-flavin reductase
MNKIAVFGASGRTGKLFTSLALNNGYSVKALLEVIQGDAADALKVEETVKGTDAVIDLIGSSGASLSCSGYFARLATQGRPEAANW